MAVTYRIDADWDGDGGLTKLSEWDLWAPGGSVPPSISPSTVRTRPRLGSVSLLITWGPGGSLPLAQRVVGPLVPGVEYTTTAWFWVPSGSPAVGLVIAGMGLPGFGPATTANDQWQKRSHSWTATATSHVLQVWPATSPVGGEQVWMSSPTIQSPPEDITDRVLDRGGLTVRYGRDHERALAPMSPGEATLEVDNTSRDYSPENALSPLSAYVTSGRTVRATAELAGEQYGIFYGYLDDFKVLPDPEQRSVAFSCVDPLGRLKGTRIYTEVHHGIQTGTAIHRILDEVGWPFGLRDIDQGATTIRWWWEDDTDAYDALLRVVDSEGPGALVTVDTEGRVIFRDRHHRMLRSESLTVQATISDDDEPAMSELVYDHGWRDIVNAVSYQVPVRVQAGITTVWSLAGVQALADGETIGITARASDPFVNAITPEAGTDFTLRQGTVEVWLDRTSGQSVGIFFRATGGPAVIADVSLRAAPITTAATLSVRAEDSTSIEQHGRRGLPSSREPVWAGLNDALAIAQLHVVQRAERLPTVQVTMRGAGHDDRLAVQLGRNLSDRIHIVEAETGLDRPFFVETIEHHVSGLQHETVFGCEAAPVQVDNVFRFDVTGQGFDDGRFGRDGLSDPATLFRFDVAGQGFNQGMFAY